MFKNIYGCICNGNPVAYCHSMKHKGYLTVKNMKAHECLKKRCSGLQKLEHQYWEERKRIKELRKEKKCQKGNELNR